MSILPCIFQGHACCPRGHNILPERPRGPPQRLPMSSKEFRLLAMWSTSKRDRCLRASMLILTCVACIALVYISLISTGHHLKEYSGQLKEEHIEQAKLTEESCIPVCDSKECIYEAGTLLRSVDPATDPCDDYHKFLCGSYVQKFGPDENGNVILENTILLRHKLRGIINNIEAEPDSASAKMKIFYDSCANIDSDLRGVEHFKEFLKELGIPNWPDLPRDFIFHNNSFPKLLASVRLSLIFCINFHFESTAATENRVGDKFVKVVYNSYAMKPIPKEVATEILEYFNIESEKIETIISDFEDVSTMVSNLQINGTCEENCNIRVNCSMPDDEEWKDVCEMAEHYLTITELKNYARADEIIVRKTEAQAVKNLIPRLKSLSDRSFANFFGLSLLWNYLEELNFYFRQKKVKYFKYFEDDDRRAMRIDNKWEHCIYLVTSYMKMPLENEFVHQYFAKSVMEEVLEIHNSYIYEVSDEISAQEWIPSDWSMGMTNFIRRMRSNLSYLKEMLPNETYADGLYKVFHPSKTNFFWNVQEVRRALMNSESKHATLVFGYDEFQTNFKVNAHTDFEAVITFHYGMVMPPWHFPGYNGWRNRLMSTPAIVHEIGHIVVANLGVISENSDVLEEIFSEKKKCIINQFSQFKFNILDEHLNGTRYYDENLSDNLAYAFLDKIIENCNSSQEYLLPGLPYPMKQQLYMAATQEFCATSNLKQEMYYKTSDPHAPLEFRIIGPAQNSRKFSEAFQCPEGSYMNPKTKCSLLDM